MKSLVVMGNMLDFIFTCLTKEEEFMSYFLWKLWMESTGTLIVAILTNVLLKLIHLPHNKVCIK